MEQILESAYFEYTDKWDEVARQCGGLEICDNLTGEPMYTIYGNDEEDRMETLL
ncbi:hypothetical protein HOU40_gp131 [Lactobacillus phage Bromius]|uniref:Uncharacterized protein n=2 Tax=Harbinvirus TaxID=2732970 RepID=A0A3Q8I002_9CAUD|nr:hypothetical protein HOS80_gp134 [Lactobacillus phage Semele]YP_009814518.1 hypothetical protein HOU40_gp131 [Lactobacillus phage Bromius]AUV60160.1 hypothetical protein [Lactobacillus phage Semele]AYH92367.1 hypothetical protein [Lactobacillus phage Bromius]